MRYVVLALGLVAAALPAQTAAPTPPAGAGRSVLPASALPALPRVAIVTSRGRFVIEADTAHAPISAGNFLRYVDRHLMDGTRFYRVVKVDARFGFVQFGSDGDPKKTLAPVAHEPTTATGLKHLDGTVSTARLAPGTARGEFTIAVGDQPSFDADPTKPGDNQGYAAFGHVVEGMDVVLAIFDTPVSPTATVRGAFRGEVPADPVTIVSARRIPPLP
jgi:peptidyl-prolyl cis-trans isomerase A (cyclophilin A)